MNSIQSSTNRPARPGSQPASLLRRRPAPGFSLGFRPSVPGTTHCPSLSRFLGLFLDTNRPGQAADFNIHRQNRSLSRRGAHRPLKVVPINTRQTARSPSPGNPPPTRIHPAQPSRASDRVQPTPPHGRAQVNATPGGGLSIFPVKELKTPCASVTSCTQNDARGAVSAWREHESLPWFCVCLRWPYDHRRPAWTVHPNASGPRSCAGGPGCCVRLRLQHACGPCRAHPAYGGEPLPDGGAPPLNDEQPPGNGARSQGARPSLVPWCLPSCLLLESLRESL